MLQRNLEIISNKFRLVSYDNEPLMKNSKANSYLWLVFNGSHLFYSLFTILLRIIWKITFLVFPSHIVTQGKTNILTYKIVKT